MREQHRVVEFKSFALIIVERKLQKGDGVAKIDEEIADEDEDGDAEEQGADDFEGAVHGGDYNTAIIVHRIEIGK